MEDIAEVYLQTSPTTRYATLAGNIWVAGTDVAKSLEYSDCTKAVRQHVPATMKRSLRSLIDEGATLAPNMGGLVHNDLSRNFVNKEGLKHLICKSRQASSMAVTKELGLEALSHIKVPTIEQEIMHSIREAFPDKVMDLQHKVTTVTDTYRLDLVFPEYALIVECDEHNHTGYNKAQEIHREAACMASSEMDAIIRFNPHSIDFSIFKLIGKIRLTMKKIEDVALNKRKFELAEQELAVKKQCVHAISKILS